MATFTTATGAPITIGLRSELGEVISVEKWSETNTTTSTTVSGGGGFLYQGTGRIDPTEVRTVTATRTDRHTRIYYRTESGVQQSVTGYGMDLEVLNGAAIEVVWFTAAGFNDKVAGFLDHHTRRWYLLNDGGEYLRNWLGYSWISFGYLAKYNLTLLGIAWVGFLIHRYLGLFLLITLGLGGAIGTAKTVLPYLFKRSRYLHKGAFDRAALDLRREFIARVGG